MARYMNTLVIAIITMIIYKQVSLPSAGYAYESKIFVGT